MKKQWYGIAGMAVWLCLAGVGGALAAPGLDQDPAYLMLQTARPGTAQHGLYLDKSSIHVTDVEKDGMIVAAVVAEEQDGSRTAVHSVTYRLQEAGGIIHYAVKGTDGAWHDLPKNSDDPSAVAGLRIWEELGNPERRDQFVAEIQQILLKKQKHQDGAPAETAPAAESAGPAAAPETAAGTGEKGDGAAPAAASAPADSTKAEQALHAAEAAAGRVKTEAAPAEAPAGTAPETPAESSGRAPGTGTQDGQDARDTKKASGEGTASSQPQTAAPAQPAPPVVVEIHSHEPDVKVEVLPAAEEQDKRAAPEEAAPPQT